MAKHDAPGQKKSHEATRTLADGTVETRTFTQEEWRNRDKSEGWERPVGEDDTEEPEAPTV